MWHHKLNNSSVLLPFKILQTSKVSEKPLLLHPHWTQALILPLFHLFSPLRLSWPTCSDHNLPHMWSPSLDTPNLNTQCYGHTYMHTEYATCENSVDEKDLQDDKPGLVWAVVKPLFKAMVGLDKCGHMRVHMFWWFLISRYRWWGEIREDTNRENRKNTNLGKKKKVERNDF